MIKAMAALTLLCAACSNTDNVAIGDIGSGSTTPEVLFDGIGSAIHGLATLHDVNGNPVGDPQIVVILSDVANLCARLKAHPDYFRNAPEGYKALIFFLPTDNVCQPGEGIRLGTFFIGRDCDEGTNAEIVAANGAQPTTPFHGLVSSYIALTEWSTSGNATGSFGLLFDDPYGSGLSHPFQGRFKTNPCATLEGTLLP